jgi:hypothetical protein
MGSSLDGRMADFQVGQFAQAAGSMRHPGAARRAPGLLQQQKNRRSKPLARGLDLGFFQPYISTLSSPDGAHSRWMQDAPLVIEALCSLDRSVV